MKIFINAEISKLSMTAKKPTSYSQSEGMEHSLKPLH